MKTIKVYISAILSWCLAFGPILPYAHAEGDYYLQLVKTINNFEKPETPEENIQEIAKSYLKIKPALRDLNLLNEFISRNIESVDKQNPNSPVDVTGNLTKITSELKQQKQVVQSLIKTSLATNLQSLQVVINSYNENVLLLAYLSMANNSNFVAQ